MAGPPWPDPAWPRAYCPPQKNDWGKLWSLGGAQEERALEERPWRNGPGGAGTWGMGPGGAGTGVRMGAENSGGSAESRSSGAGAGGLDSGEAGGLDSGAMDGGGLATGTAAGLPQRRTAAGLTWPRTAAGLRWSRTAGWSELRTAAGLPQEQLAGMPQKQPAGLPQRRMAAGLTWPRMAAGLRWPRTAGWRELRPAGWFWIGAGHSPDTRGSLLSSWVRWCLGGPRGDGRWPRSRTESLAWNHPAPSTRRAHRTPAHTPTAGGLGGQGQRTARRSPLRSKNGNILYGEKVPLTFLL